MKDIKKDTKKDTPIKDAIALITEYNPCWVFGKISIRRNHTTIH